MKLTYMIAFLTLSALLLAPEVSAATPASTTTLTPPNSAAGTQIDAAYGKLALSFEAYRDEKLKLVAVWRKFYPQLELLVGLTILVVLGYGGWRTAQGLRDRDRQRSRTPHRRVGRPHLTARRR